MQKAKADQAAAQVEQARAQLNQAKLNLSYTKIVAPVDGIITTKNVEVGQNVSVGQNMVTLVSLHDLWVTANFKETQLHLMRPNQTVKIHVDMNGRDYDGVVTQIGGATGSMLSLFPPENATGNYVKVVQRVPVRIDFTKPEEDKDHILRPGLSVEPTVRRQGELDVSQISQTVERFRCARSRVCLQADRGTYRASNERKEVLEMSSNALKEVPRQRQGCGSDHTELAAECQIHPEVRHRRKGSADRHRTPPRARRSWAG